MAFTLYCLLEASLLCINAIAVLNEERFLSKIWGSGQRLQGFEENPGVKVKLVSIVRSVHMVMRIPLILLNTLVIVLKLVVG